MSFLFRPLGAFLAGHYGDVIGRRAMLVITPILMGAVTTLIGVLPTHEQAWLLGPILLIGLRILQGLSTGDEWGVATPHLLHGMSAGANVPAGPCSARSRPVEFH